MILAPGATIGILGSGQHGRKLAIAALKVGLRTHIFAPEAEAPAYDAAAGRTTAPFDDEAALESFAKSVDVVTYEFENVPTATVEFLNARVPVRPGARALALTQDRLTEKTFLRDAGLRTAPFAAVDDAGALARAVAELGRPAILKTRRFGYDGKGQSLIREGSNVSALYRAFAGAPMILEGFVAFEREVSVIAARSLEGEIVAFDLAENEHERHILARSRVPARVSPETAAEARRIATTVLEALDYVGVLGVELFVTRDWHGREGLVVNEIAPRVHNSGHWTLDGAQTSQFEQHIRAIAGWPLGAPTRRGRVEMHNLIGEDAEEWRDILAQPDLCLHLYGKLEIRPDRKMGHVTRLFPEPPGEGGGVGRFPQGGET
jgi:5-(carboxyamino)imidazole ribonucleotide synthase